VSRVAFKEDGRDALCFEVEGKKGVPARRFGARRGRPGWDLNELRAASMSWKRSPPAYGRGSAR